MASSVTNKPKNTGNLTNKEFGSAGQTWEEQTGTWGDQAGTWQNPYKFNNKPKNTGSLTNKAKS